MRRYKHFKQSLRKNNLLVLLGLIAYIGSVFYFFLIYRTLTQTIFWSFLFTILLVVGGRWRIWYNFILGTHTTCVHPSWQSATEGVIVGFALTTILYPGQVLIETLSTLLPLFTIVYSFAKFRCWIIGCCFSKGHFPTQLLESFVNLGFSVVLTTLLLDSKCAELCLVFALTYPIARIYFIHHRNSLSIRFLMSNIIISLCFAALGLI